MASKSVKVNVEGLLTRPFKLNCQIESLELARTENIAGLKDVRIKHIDSIVMDVKMNGRFIDIPLYHTANMTCVIFKGVT